jgi:hypothetical protein
VHSRTTDPHAPLSADGDLALDSVGVYGRLFVAAGWATDTAEAALWNEMADVISAYRNAKWSRREVAPDLEAWWDSMATEAAERKRAERCASALRRGFRNPGACIRPWRAAWMGKCAPDCLFTPTYRNP